MIKEIRKNQLHHTKEVKPNDLFMDLLLKCSLNISSYEFEFSLGLLFVECNNKYTIEIEIDDWEVDEGDYDYYYNDGLQREFISNFVPINETHLDNINNDDVEKYIDNSIGSTMKIKIHKWDE